MEVKTYEVMVRTYLPRRLRSGMISLARGTLMGYRVTPILEVKSTHTGVWVRFYMKSRFERIHIGPERIGHALRDKVLYVPPNQREYAWKDKHVKDLLDDLKNVITNDGQEYFLGSIVVTDQGDGKPRVVDGQQRLATTLIFISAIRDYFDSIQDADARKLEQIYIMSPVLGDDDRAHLNLNDRDKEYFINRVLLPSSDNRRSTAEKLKVSYPSHVRISTAARIAREYVKVLVKGLTPAVAKKLLLKWVDFLENNVVVIWVTVPDDRSAYMIFETMNDRGLVLSATDLVKNHLFLKADDLQDEAERRWSSMVGTLESVQEAEILKDYMRHYLISTVGRVRTQELFDEIKDMTPNKKTSMDFLATLAETATKYVALLNPMHGSWSGYSERSRKNIATLQHLGVKQVRPLLLAVVEQFGKHEIEKVLRLAVSWSVRFVISGDLGSGLLESTYGSSAVEVNKGSITDAKSLAGAMAKVVPTDDAFEAAFTAHRVSQASLARYYLRSLELVAKGDPEPENVPNDETVITLEHILPEEPAAGTWVDFTEEQRQQMTNRLGNQVLLKHSANSDLRSSEFSVKRPILKKAGFTLTSEVAAIPKWTPQAVAERQARLAKLAIKAWPIRI